MSSKIDLWHGDCLELMKNIPDGSIDLVLTDPPYQLTACKWDKVIPFEPMWKELKRIIKSNGAICLFGSEPFSSHLRLSNLKWFKYDWVWHKNKPSGMLNAKKQPMRDIEILSVFYAKQPSYFPIKENRIDKNNRLKTPLITKDFGSSIYGKKSGTEKKIVSDLRYPSQYKYFEVVSKRSEKKHPTQKPVALLEYLIKTYTLENETVLDFTMGSGSTGVAAKNLNRDFIGIELDETYFKIAQERIADA